MKERPLGHNSLIALSMLVNRFFAFHVCLESEEHAKPVSIIPTLSGRNHNRRLSQHPQSGDQHDQPLSAPSPQSGLGLGLDFEPGPVSQAMAAGTNGGKSEPSR